MTVDDGYRSELMFLLGGSSTVLDRKKKYRDTPSDEFQTQCPPNQDGRKSYQIVVAKLFGRASLSFFGNTSLGVCTYFVLVIKKIGIGTTLPGVR